MVNSGNTRLERDLLISIQWDNYYFWVSPLVLNVVLVAACIIVKEARYVSVLLELVFLEEMVLNKCTIIYISTYSDKYGAVILKRYSGECGGTFGRTEGYVHTLIVTITLIPRNGPAWYSGRSSALDGWDRRFPVCTGTIICCRSLDNSLDYELCEARTSSLLITAMFSVPRTLGGT